MNERANENIPDDNQNDAEQNVDRVELPFFEFGASEQEKMQVLSDTIEELPLDEQEPYWQIMDDESLSLQDKAHLVNDLLKRYNGDIKE